VLLAFEDELIMPGVTPIRFTGRDPSGRPLHGSTFVNVLTPQMLQFNSVVVRGGSPRLTGVSGTPQVTITSDPVLIVQTLDQFASIGYCLDRPARVTMKLLKPGAFDPNDPAAVVQTFLQDQLQPATNCAAGGVPNVQQFRGFALDDPDALLLNEDGVYTFSLEARDPVVLGSGRTLYLGAVNIFRSTQQ
jgi:hypothetical protein